MTIFPAPPVALARATPIVLALALLAGGAALGWAELSAARMAPAPAKLAEGDSLFWGATLKQLTTQALIRYDAAVERHDAAEARLALTTAENGLARMLVLAPADGNLWALRAEVQAELSGFGAEVAKFLELSRATSRLEFPALQKRVQLGVRFWSTLRPQEQASLRNDIQTVLAVEPKHRMVAFLADCARGRGRQTELFARAAVAQWASDWVTTFDQFLREKPAF